MSPHFLFLGHISPAGCPMAALEFPFTCGFHSPCSGSKDAFIRVKIMTFEGMRFIYNLPRLFLAGWDRACDCVSSGQVILGSLPGGVSVTHFPLHLPSCSQGLTLQLGTGGTLSAVLKMPLGALEVLWHVSLSCQFGFLRWGLARNDTNLGAYVLGRWGQS